MVTSTSEVLRLKLRRTSDVDVTIGCYQGDYTIQSTLDADVTVGCYYGDYSSCDNTIPTSLFILDKKFSLTLVYLLFNKTCARS